MASWLARLPIPSPTSDSRKTGERVENDTVFDRQYVCGLRYSEITDARFFDDCFLRSNSTSRETVLSNAQTTPPANSFRNKIKKALAMKISVLATKTKRNTGDRACLPHEYLGFEAEVVYLGKRSADGMLLVGGGGLLRDDRAKLIQDTLKHHIGPKIFWGGGLNNLGRGVDDSVPGWVFKQFDLIGIRDVIPGMQWAPCPSCMSPLFDEMPAPTKSVVVYSGALPIAPEGQPHRMCEDNMTMREAVEFLASGETVVTSSYHGWYWASLLGRRVLLVDADRNSKFFRLPISAARIHSDWSGGWQSPDHVLPPVDFLSRCREATTSFYSLIRKQFLTA